MRVLLTGHKGFIGQHLARELDRAGHTVYGHDREQGNLTIPAAFEGSLAIIEPDYVVHLAAHVGRVLGEDDLPYTINENATITALVAHACRRRGVPILYASTSEVYGDHGEGVCRESDPLTTLPHNLYGLSKRWGEEVLQMYAPAGLKIVRLSMPYGPGAPPGRGRRALDNFLWQAHHRMPIPVHRGAERSWCHVSDIVRGIRLVLERGNGIYNVARDDCPVAMMECARWACEIAGASHDLIVEIDPPPMQTVVKRTSNDRLRLLGWMPKVELHVGMVELYDWVKQFDAQGNLCPVAA